RRAAGDDVSGSMPAFDDDARRTRADDGAALECLRGVESGLDLIDVGLCRQSRGTRSLEPVARREALRDQRLELGFLGFGGLETGCRFTEFELSRCDLIGDRGDLELH